MNFLNEHERATLRTQHKQERDKRVADRIKAVLLYDDGWLPQQIAKVLLISDQAIRDHIDDYKIAKKLTIESGGSNEKLSKEQSEQLEAHLQEHTYLYRKEIPANTGRSRLNLSGAIDVVSQNVVIQEDQTLNAESTIRVF